MPTPAGKTLRTDGNSFRKPSKATKVPTPPPPPDTGGKRPATTKPRQKTPEQRANHVGHNTAYQRRLKETHTRFVVWVVKDAAAKVRELAAGHPLEHWLRRAVLTQINLDLLNIETSPNPPEGRSQARSGRPRKVKAKTETV